MIFSDPRLIRGEIRVIRVPVGFGYNHVMHAILLATHDNRILDIADRILTLDDGRISSFTSGMTATAEQLTDAPAIEHGISIFSRESVRQGVAQEWAPDQVTGEARLRLYRANVHEYSILDPDVPFDVRVDVRP